MVISEEREALRDWKLPPSSASDVFEVNGCLGGLIPDWTVHTAEGEIVLYNKDSLSSGIFPNERKRWHESMGYIGLQVGMITVGLKPNKLGTDISATVSLRDMKFYPMFNIDDARIESNLHDGPIYFSHYSPFCFSLCDMPKRLTVVVKIGRAVKWNERVTLMYRFHYKVMRKFGSSAPSRPPRGEDGLPIFFVANVNAERNVSVEALRRLLLDRIAENNILTSGGRNASLDWRETGEEHVLKVDVPGFKEEEVRVEEAVVEGLRVLEINGERGQEEVEGRWHCVERINGKFLHRVRLPEDVKMDEMKVAVENGVLTVIVPKKVVYVEHSYMFDDD